MGHSFSSVRSTEMNPVLSKPRSRDNVARTREKRRGNGPVSRHDSRGWYAIGDRDWPSSEKA